MRVALINPPLTGHFARGTGTYIKNLSAALGDIAGVEVIESDSRRLPNDVDLYHFPYFDPFFRTLPLMRRKKTLVTIHDLIPLRFAREFPRGVRGELVWQLQRFILGGVEGIITDSAASKKDIEKFVKIEPEQIQIVYLAPADLFFRRVTTREKLKLAEKFGLPKKFALYVGDANWNKNLPGIFRAATIARVPLVAASKPLTETDDTYHPWKDSLLKAKTVVRNNPYIHILGYIEMEELATLYQLATVLVTPSFFEGFGLPVVEAFAAGCPVICSDRGSLAEITADAAVIVDPTHEGEIATALQTVFKDRQLRQRMSQKGQVQARNFTWAKTARATYDVYSRTLES